jgi:hypothetical protein
MKLAYSFSWHGWKTLQMAPFWISLPAADGVDDSKLKSMANETQWTSSHENDLPQEILIFLTLVSHGSPIYDLGFSKLPRRPFELSGFL